MWHPALDDVECPVTWDGVEVLDEDEKQRIQDRLVASPKTWKRSIAKLHLAHSEYCDGENANAKRLLIEAYAGILEPLSEVNMCGASVVYRRAMKHVLDAMWTYVEMDDIETSDEDGYYEDSPRYKHLIAFAEAISPVRKMDFRQQAAVYAIRGVLTSNPDSQIWIQKAVHLNPSEAQWVIDLAYAVWDEDPEEPGPDEPDHLDASLTARGVALIAQGSSPSHNAKGCKLSAFGRLVDRQPGPRPPKWTMDLELILLMGRCLFLEQRKRKGSCRLGACKSKKKCTCEPGWIKDLLKRVLATALDSDGTSAAVLTQLALTLDRAGDKAGAVRGLLEACRLEPLCQYIHQRLAVQLLPLVSDKDMAARAVSHAKRCLRLYPFTLEYIKQGIEYFNSHHKPKAAQRQGLRKAGSRIRKC